MVYRERKFFSEEKNQKTFGLALADGYRPWPDRWEAAEKLKSFGSFFAKNAFSYLLVIINLVGRAPAPSGVPAVGEILWN